MTFSIPEEKKIQALKDLSDTMREVIRFIRSIEIQTLSVKFNAESNYLSLSLSPNPKLETVAKHIRDCLIYINGSWQSWEQTHSIYEIPFAYLDQLNDREKRKLKNDVRTMFGDVYENYEIESIDIISLSTWKVMNSYLL